MLNYEGIKMFQSYHKNAITNAKVSLNANNKNNSVIEANIFYTAYILTHVKSGDFYIGSTNDFKNRRWQHIRSLNTNKHSNLNLQKRYNEDKELSFSIFIANDREDAYKIEQELIDYHKNDPKFLNIGLDVKAPNLGKKLSDVTRAKIALKRGILHHSYGKHFSEEHKRKISESNLGKVNSQESIEKNRLAHLGKKHTDSAKEKMRIFRTGKQLGKDNPWAKGVSVEGKEYSTVKEAYETLKIAPSTLWKRLNHKEPGYNNWFYINRNE